MDAIRFMKAPPVRPLTVLVRVVGLEPTRIAAQEPKSGVSTNFTIPADTAGIVAHFTPPCKECLPRRRGASSTCPVRRKGNCLS